MTSRQDSGPKVLHREPWVDNLRVALIAGVIVVHAATGYVVDIPWYYDDEQSTSGVWPVVLGFPVFAGGVFGLGPLFFVAGWFAAGSLERRGPAGFARARLARLGLPLLLFVLVLQPLTDYIGNLRSERGSFLYYLGMTEVSVMWFVAALLVFTLVHAGARRLRREARPPPAYRLGTVLAFGATTIALTSFAVWQVWPWNAEVVLNLRLGEWPQAAVLYVLGVHAAKAGWLRRLPARTVRELGWVAVLAAVGLTALFGAEVAWGDVDVLLLATSMIPALAFAVLDGILAVSWTVWCVAWFERRWTRRGPLLEVAGRASYATYVLHPLVLTTLMVLFAPVDLPPVAKFAVISAVGVPLCFLAGRLLSRAPGASRVF